jgi:excisionase family DNA binding protein
MTNAPEYLRAGDIARLTGVSLRTARRWIANQILVSGKVGGARLVAKRELERACYRPLARSTRRTSMTAKNINEIISLLDYRENII